jgi:hypothetical protein
MSLSALLGQKKKKKIKKGVGSEPITPANSYYVSPGYIKFWGVEQLTVLKVFTGYVFSFAMGCISCYDCLCHFQNCSDKKKN